MIRVVLPFHLRRLAQVDGEVTLDIASPVTPRRILDALETHYPTLRGTIRDYANRSAPPHAAFLCVRRRHFASAIR